MIDTKKLFTVRNMTIIGVFTALCFVANWLQFPIPTPIGSTRFHLGNVMCLLAGFVLGPVPGGIAAGLGGMFFDFTYPEYVSEAWITFLLKFAMAWLCGKIASGNHERPLHIRRDILAAISGSLFYVILYSLKNFLYNYYFLRMEWTPVWLAVGQKALVSTVNGIIAVICAVPLSIAVRAALRRAPLSGSGHHTPSAGQ